MLPFLKFNQPPRPPPLPALRLSQQLLQLHHMLPRHDLVLRPTQHQDGRHQRDELHPRRAVPFLVAEEGDAREHGHGGGDEAWEGEECVLEDECADLVWVLD